MMLMLAEENGQQLVAHGGCKAIQDNPSRMLKI